MPELMQSIADSLFYIICFGIAVMLLNGGGGGGKRARMPV
jgi:hypothetical protein